MKNIRFIPKHDEYRILYDGVDDLELVMLNSKWALRSREKKNLSKLYEVCRDMHIPAKLDESTKNQWTLSFDITPYWDGIGLRVFAKRNYSIEIEEI